MGAEELAAPDRSSEVSTRKLKPLWLRMTGWSLIWLAFAVGAVLAGAALWIRRTFGSISIDQMLLNLPGVGGMGITDTETGYIAGFVAQAVILPLSIVLVIAGIAVAFQGIRRFREKHAEIVPIRKGPRWYVRALPVAVAGVVLVTGVGMLAQTTGVVQYIRSMNSSFTLASYYVVPEVNAPQTPHNLILIYLESIEDGLGDDELFEKNMLQPIEAVTESWGQSQGFRMFEGGGWTMAGIVGTQCGVPLRGMQSIELGTHNSIGTDSESFLPGATCLGDILSEAGYTNVFLGGADTRFAAKENFLRDHGYNRILDLRTWSEQGETEISSWGLSDRALFEQAKAEVLRLHAQEDPFNLTLLTLDNHLPVHVFDYCEVTTEVVMTSVTYCSMLQVADFARFLDAEGILEDTAVIIVGDHETFISGGSDYQELLTLEERTVFLRVHSPDGVRPMRDGADQLSIFATALDLLGFESKNRRAGVGVSLFEFTPGRKTALALNADQYSEALQSRSSELYARLWGHDDRGDVYSDFFDPKEAVSEGDS